MQHIVVIISIILAKIGKKGFYLSFLLLLLFMSLRYNFGNDYMSYLEGYELIKLGQNSHIGNSYLYKKLNIISPNFYFLITAISFFYLVVIFSFIKKNLGYNRYWFSLLLLLGNPYLFFIHLSTIRQTLAILFFILSVDFIYKKNFKKYFLLNLIGSEFHRSSIILIPLYFIITTKKISRIAKIFIIIIVFFLLSDYLYIIIEKILIYFPGYKHYLEIPEKLGVRSVVISSFYVYFIFKYINKLNDQKMIYGKLYMIGTIIQILAFNIPMLTRIGMYFDIFMVVAIPQIFSIITSKREKIINFGMILLILLLRYVSFFNTPLWKSFFSYKTIF